MDPFSIIQPKSREMCKKLSLFFFKDLQPSPGEANHAEITKGDEADGFNQGGEGLGFCGNENDSDKSRQTDKDGKDREFFHKRSHSHKKLIAQTLRLSKFQIQFQDQEDSNLRMNGSEPFALPLGDGPINGRA